MDSFSDVFERVKQLCRGEMSEVAYDLWIRELELTALDSSTACLQCTTQFKRDIVNEKYNALLTASFEEIMGFPVQVEITSREAAPAAQENNRLDFQPEKEYSFETFVVGSGNSLAHAAAWAVANNPAKSYNPLFMYGGSGLGKTHLIYAICGKIRQNHPDYKLLYVKGEEFMLKSIINKDFGKIRSDYDDDSAFEVGLAQKSIYMLSRVGVHGSDDKVYVITIPTTVPGGMTAIKAAAALAMLFFCVY